MSTKTETVFTFDRAEPFYMTPEQNLKFLSNGWGDFTEEEMQEFFGVMNDKLTDEDKTEIKRAIEFSLNSAKKQGKIMKDEE